MMRTCLAPSIVLPWTLSILLLFFKILIRWRNIVLGFSIKVIFGRWMFIVDGKHLILDGSWWKCSWFTMMFFLELYQFFFLFFRILFRWRNIFLVFSLNVICRRCMFIGKSKHVFLNRSRWRLSQCIMVSFLELYQLF